MGDLPDRQALARLPEPILVNCTGLGARELFGDQGLVAIKGQLVVLRPQPEVDYLTVGAGRFSESGGVYMFPRSDGVLLGGTFERGVESLAPDPAASARILAVHARFFEAMAEKG